MRDVQEVQAQIRITFSLRFTNGSKGKEDSDLLQPLLTGAPVYVWRTHQKICTGPFWFFSIEGEAVVCQLPLGRYVLSTTVVKLAGENLLRLEQIRGN